jgi:hypothetical protein
VKQRSGACRTEERVQVAAEAVDVAGRADERVHVPVRVRAAPERPRVPADVDARLRLRADGLNAAAAGQPDHDLVRRRRRRGRAVGRRAEPDVVRDVRAHVGRHGRVAPRPRCRRGRDARERHALGGGRLHVRVRLDAVRPAGPRPRRAPRDGVAGRTHEVRALAARRRGGRSPQILAELVRAGGLALRLACAAVSGAASEDERERDEPVMVWARAPAARAETEKKRAYIVY